AWRSRAGGGAVQSIKTTISRRSVEFAIRELLRSPSHHPGGCCIGARPVNFSIQICQLDGISESCRGLCAEIGDVLGNRALLALGGCPEICKRPEVHANRAHFLHDVCQAGLLPRTSQVARAAHGLRIFLCPTFISSPIEEGCGVENHTQRREST